MYKERRGGRWPHVIHRFKVQDKKTAEYEEALELTPIEPVVLPKIKIVDLKTIPKETNPQEK
jgi:hypothetical protein